MDELMGVSVFFGFIGFIISLITLIVFFVMAANVGKSTRLLRAILIELRKTEIDKKSRSF